jgi:hypothetical protein
MFDGMCTQYEIRPVDCMKFECKVLKGYLNNEQTFEQAESTIEIVKVLLDDLLEKYRDYCGTECSLGQNSIFAQLDQEYKSLSITPEEKERFKSLYPEYFLILILIQRYFSNITS